MSNEILARLDHWKMGSKIVKADALGYRRLRSSEPSDNGGVCVYVRGASGGSLISQVQHRASLLWRPH